MWVKFGNSPLNLVAVMSMWIRLYSFDIVMGNDPSSIFDLRFSNRNFRIYPIECGNEPKFDKCQNSISHKHCTWSTDHTSYLSVNWVLTTLSIPQSLQGYFQSIDYMTYAAWLTSVVCWYLVKLPLPYQECYRDSFNSFNLINIPSNSLLQM